MQPLAKKHAAILDSLLAALGERGHLKIDNAPGAFLPVVIEDVGPSRYSVARYYEQNGDLVPDPDVEFVRQDGAWFPVAITQWCGYSRAAECDAEGRIVAVDRREYRDLRSFAGTFLANIQEQQGLSRCATCGARKGGTAVAS